MYVLTMCHTKWGGRAELGTWKWPLSQKSSSLAFNLGRTDFECTHILGNWMDFLQGASKPISPFPIFFNPLAIKILAFYLLILYFYYYIMSWAFCPHLMETCQWACSIWKNQPKNKKETKSNDVYTVSKTCPADITVFNQNKNT